MATIGPIPPGGIVSVPDPVTGGAGAPLLTSQIVNGTWQNGQTRTLDALNRIDQAGLLIGPAPQTSVPNVDMTYLPPVAPILTPSDPAEAIALYDDKTAEITVLIQQGIENFQATYFPDIQPVTDAALQWLLDVFNNGGTGINPAVEQQLWERDKARILNEASRNEREAMSTFADRGFPLPPGALAGQVMQLRTAAFAQLATQSRDIAVKTLETAIENARFAVQQALPLRVQALTAAGDYIKTLILGPQTGMQLATGIMGLRNDFARTLTSLYAAQAQAAEPRLRLQLGQAELDMRSQETNVRAIVETVNARVKLAEGAAQMLATQAAALLNGINAGVSISGSDSSSL